MGLAERNLPQLEPQSAGYGLILSRSTNNGHLPERDILARLGSVPVWIPKIRDRGGEQSRFRLGAGAAICAKAQRVEAVLPWL